MRRSAVALGVVLAAVSAAPSLSAQSGSAEAAELFKQGRAALQAKDYAAACPKFVASLRLERAVGTLISLADCEQATGRLASARQHWQEAADFADALHDSLNRGAYARQKFADIDKRVPKLVLRLANGAPKDTAVRRDSVDLGTTGFDAPFPLDPGAHTIIASAMGHEPKTYAVDLKEGEQKTLEVGPGPDVLPGAPVAGNAVAPAAPSATPAAIDPNAAVAPVSAAVSPAPVSPGASPVSPESTGGNLRTVGLVTAGLGVVGLAVGTVYGITAIGKKSDAGCSSEKVCPDETAAKTFREATSAGTTSTIFFAAGTVLAAVGVTLYVVAPKERASASVQIGPSVAMGTAGMNVSGSW